MLHLNGWPLGANIEIFEEIHMNGSMSLLLPAMETLKPSKSLASLYRPTIHTIRTNASKQRNRYKRYYLYILDLRKNYYGQPNKHFAAQLAAQYLAGLAKKYRYSDLRRLQLAATEGDMLSILFRDGATRNTQAPSSLRLLINNHRRVTVLKQRGGKQNITIQLANEEKDRCKLSSIKNLQI